jgi:amidase
MSGVHGRRAIGYLKPPTPGEVSAYAERLGLVISPAEIDDWIAAVAGSLALYDHLDELPEPRSVLRHTRRDPGWVPSAAEDSYNAIIRFCEVTGADDGPLAGRRLGVKDCIAVAGLPMTVGGRRQPYPVPTEDAVVIERLLDAGAVITAKTNMEDMALGLGEGSAFGAARNPHNPRYSTGGSSSGSGAAVAAGLVDLALGADEAGSVRIPSAWCGLVGMKATHGLVPSHGLTYMDHTVDHIGPMTTSVADNALMLEIMAGADWRDPQWVRDLPAGPFSYLAGREAGVEGMRIGVVTEALEPMGCTPAVLDAFEVAQKRLTSLGAELVPVSVPLWTDSTTILMGSMGFGLLAMFESLGQGYGHLGRIDVNQLATTAAQVRSGARDLPHMLKGMLLTGVHLREAYAGVHFGKAQNLRLELRRQIESVLASTDLLVTPTTPVGAFELADQRLSDAELAAAMNMAAVANTCPLDLTGNPALTLPSGRDEHDVPLGLQIIGPRFGEADVYRAAFAYEAAAAS